MSGAGWKDGRESGCPASLPSEEIVSIAQESALAPVLVNIAIIDSHYGKHCVRIKCDGDTSWEEAENLRRDRQIVQNPLGAPGLKIKRQFEGGQEDPDCTSTHLNGGAMPMPAERGALGRTRAADGHIKSSRVGGWPEDPTSLGRCGVAGSGSKTPRKTTLEKQPLGKG